ncbi:MAG: sigma factor-like helix-turn-helix DNA-binding protein, partial [Raoultibacter sp.]
SAGTGSGRGQVEPAVVALIVLLDDLGKEAEQLTAKRNFVKELIDSIDEKSRKQFSLVLHLRYISGLTFEEIAEELEMSVRHIHRLHLEAVDYIASVI